VITAPTPIQTSQLHVMKGIAVVPLIGFQSFWQHALHFSKNSHFDLQISKYFSNQIN
jgi:hypothetical protein